tara:strand:+ start:2807 stop:4078 length:1272 start_codon:yes stop_codon:yes gene_type:complete
MNLKILKSQSLILLSLIFVFCLIFFEAPPRLRKFYLKNVLKFEKIFCKNLTIKNINFDYGSCPNTKYFSEGDPNDENLNSTVIYTDSIGGRVDKFSKGKIFNSDDYKIYLIGDSFIHATAIPYQETVYGIINKFRDSSKQKAYGFGMGSWTSKEYLQSIKAINAKKSSYDVFLFANDFTPHDHRARIRLDSKEKISNQVEPVSKKTNNSKNKIKNINDVLTLLANKTYTFNKIREIYFSFKLKRRYKDNISLTQFKKKNRSDCSFIGTFENKVPKYMFDYLVLNLPYNCWGQIYKDTYQLVLNDMKEMIKEAKKRDSKIRFIYIPPGFSFKGEFFPGRNYYKNYGPGIPSDKELKLKGLTAKLSSDIRDKFINLDYPIQLALDKYKFNNDCKKGKCNNILYFANDGHLNSKGHQFLYEYLYEN